MSKQLFEDSDGDEGVPKMRLKTDNSFAKSYDNWRKKEELNKFKTKYGSEFLKSDSGSSSSSSEDDEDDITLDQELEKEFFRALASVKSKNPKIYDEKTRFFANITIDPAKNKKPKKDKPLSIHDYERKLLLEKGSSFHPSSDEERDEQVGPSYVEEQAALKTQLKNALDNVQDDWQSVCVKRQKLPEEQAEEEAEYKKWLKGQQSNLTDETVEQDLKPLKDYWADSNLNQSEKYLRDFILNQRFLENKDPGYVPTYDEVVHDSDGGLSEDEECLDKQEDFEVKYNYRFEEPDQEFIKRYPRTMLNSLRKTEDKRKTKRVEVRERKVREKEEKMRDLRDMQMLKRREIEEKLEKLREVTGNEEGAFDQLDFDSDFDPEEHDRRMRGLFNEDFYQGPEGEQKPEFPDLDEELEIERWDRDEVEVPEPHCEDENFNMDCDYDPEAQTSPESPSTKGRKKRKRRSKFAETVAEPKPAFDPQSATYQQYLDQYYQLDCEDVIGDVPCRFKYRQVAPNSFGLTIEEILLAKDRELNRWCSLKKAVQIRPESVEKYDLIAYRKKGSDEALKRKLLPSLYQEAEASNANKNPEASTSKNKAKNEQKPASKNNREPGASGSKNVDSEASENCNELSNSKEALASHKMASRNKQMAAKAEEDEASGSKDATETKQAFPTKIESSSTNRDALLRSKKASKNEGKNNEAVSNIIPDGRNEEQSSSKTEEDSSKKRRKSGGKRRKKSGESSEKDVAPISGKKRKRHDSSGKAPGNKKSKNSALGMSDARLTAYGIKPKKFKNKLKYGNQQQKQN